MFEQMFERMGDDATGTVLRSMQLNLRNGTSGGKSSIR